jgi:hypothetical protein
MDIHTTTATEKRNFKAMFEEIKKAIETTHDYVTI